jgi:hypothetical protein
MQSTDSQASQVPGLSHYIKPIRWVFYPSRIQANPQEKSPRENNL